MTPSNPPPDPPISRSERELPFHFGRVVVFVFLLLLAPVAIFLGGFCCCLSVVGAESFEAAIIAFILGIAFSSIVVIYLLVVINKRLFASHQVPLNDDANYG